MENILIFHTLARVFPVHYAYLKAYIRLMYEFRNTLMRIGEHVHFCHANVYMFATQMCTLSPELTRAVLHQANRPVYSSPNNVKTLKTFDTKIDEKY